MMQNSENYIRLTANDISNEGCMNILKGFMRRLGLDYARSFEYFLKNSRDENARFHYEHLREFVLSDYFGKLTNLDGESIVKEIEYHYKDVLDGAA